ncbi:MAG: recombination-associated protein RdgC [Lautropia sp.]
MNAFFRNAMVYRLAPSWSLDAATLDAQLERQRFVSDGSGAQSIGWMPVVDAGPLAHVVNGQVLLTLRTEKKLLPASVVNQVAKARAQEIEEQQGYKPGRRQLKEIREAVTDELMPRAFSVWRDTRIWIDPVHHWLLIDTSSPARADEIVTALSKSIDPFPLKPLRLAKSPVQMMTAWLASDEAPAGFTIDQDTELKATGDSRAAIRYTRQSIGADDARRHIDEGKQCTRMALTWSDRISFVLTDPLVLRRIAPLDVTREAGGEDAGDAVARFDSDFALMSGELARLLPDLIDALGGELDEQVIEEPQRLAA